MVALPFVANEFGVLQLVMVFPMLFGLDTLFRYFRHPDWQAAAIVGVWVAVSFLTSEYYAYFLLLALAIVSIVMIVRTKLRVAQIVHAAIAAGVALLLAGPFLAAQAARIRGYAWPRDVVADLGANPRDWFRLHDSALGSHLPLIGTAPGAQIALYPGTILLVLAYFGIRVRAAHSCVGSSPSSCSRWRCRSSPTASASTCSAGRRTSSCVTTSRASPASAARTGSRC